MEDHFPTEEECLEIQPVEITPIFDREAFLGRVMDDEDLARDIAVGFLEDIPNQISILKDFIDRKKAERAGEQAHKLKGASANVGGLSFSAVAYEMERAGKDGDLEKMGSMMAELEKRFEILKEEMEAFIS